MEVEFATRKLEKLFASKATLKKSLGEPSAKKAMTRLDDLEAMPALEGCRDLPGNFHELKGDLKGHIAVALHGGARLVLRPSAEPPPSKEDGGLDWSKVTAVTIVSVGDYH